jgi:hypothetical protein
MYSECFRRRYVDENDDGCDDYNNNNNDNTIPILSYYHQIRSQDILRLYREDQKYLPFIPLVEMFTIILLLILIGKNIEHPNFIGFPIIV